jgi:beta-galactosidase
MPPPKIHLWDYTLKASFNDDFSSALLNVGLDFRNFGSAGKTTCDIYLAEYGRRVSDEDLILSLASVHPTGSPGLSVSHEVEVASPRLWSAEIPNLYQVIFVVKDAANQVTEVLSTPFGFRQIRIRDQQLWVNGQSVLLKRGEPP